MEEERVILCCNAKTWARVIAWLNIVIFAIDAVVSFIGIFTGGNVGAYVVTVLVDIAIVCMGVVLLRGVQHENPRYVHFWIIAAIIFIVLFILELLMHTLLGRFSLYVVFVNIIYIFAFVFAVWVVRIFKQQIDTVIA